MSAIKNNAGNSTDRVPNLEARFLLTFMGELARRTGPIIDDNLDPIMGLQRTISVIFLNSFIRTNLSE
jgi:hypothetical protein